MLTWVGCAAARAQAPSSREAPALDPRLPPGNNFDLRLWELQEPVGAPGAPTTVGREDLVAGFHDAYFFTDATDGAMTFWAPVSGVTTANSRFPRTELRELAADGTAANWPVAGSHAMSAVVTVVGVPDHVCIGQIHVGAPLRAGLPPSTKPLLELYEYADGEVVVGIEEDPVSGGQRKTPLAHVAPGARVRYVVRLTGDGSGGGLLAVAIDGAERSFVMPAGFDGYGEYFKAGDYVQTVGVDPTVGATVKFYELHVAHAP